MLLAKLLGSGGRSDHEAEPSFSKIMGMAEAIAKDNAAGLHQLIRALLLPLQAKHLLTVAEVEQHKAPSYINSRTFFFPLDKIGLSTDFSVKPTPHVVLSLSSDIVLTTPWERSRYASALAQTGEGRARGAWRSDVNHSVSIWLPWRIGFVGNGNHSIAAGILSAEGELAATSVYDMSPALGVVKCNGKHFINTKTGEKISEVWDVRRAAVFEIGRMLIDQ